MLLWAEQPRRTCKSTGAWARIGLRQSSILSHNSKIARSVLQVFKKILQSNFCCNICFQWRRSNKPRPPCWTTMSTATGASGLARLAWCPPPMLSGTGWVAPDTTTWRCNVQKSRTTWGGAFFSHCSASLFWAFSKVRNIKCVFEYVSPQAEFSEALMGCSPSSHTTASDHGLYISIVQYICKDREIQRVWGGFPLHQSERLCLHSAFVSHPLFFNL